MNIFIPYSHPREVALSLDRKRLTNQINEARLVIGAIKGENGWSKHPVTRMYTEWLEWLEWYTEILRQVANGVSCSNIILTEPSRPPFIGYEPLHRAHRSRLNQKKEYFYTHFRDDASFTDLNWYVVDGWILKYKNGKLIEKEKFKK